MSLLGRSREILAAAMRWVGDGASRLGDAVAPGAAPAGRGEPLAFSQPELLDAIGQAVVVTDVTGRIVSVNRAVVSLLGWEPAELVGRSVLDVFLAHRPAAEVMAQLRRVVAGEPLSREILARRRDGSTFPAVLHVQPQRGADKTVTSMVGVAIDITDLKRAERAARNSEERLDLALTAGRCNVYEWDVATDRVYRSHQCMEIFGVPEAFCEGSGAEWFAHVEPADHGVLRQALQALSPEQPTYRLTYRFRRPDGGIVTIEDRARGDFDASGRLVRLTGMNRDVTAAHEARRALTESEARLRNILDKSPAHIFLKDLDGSYLFVNEALAANLGMQAADMLGRTVYDIVPTAAAERFQANDRRVLETMQVAEFEDRLPRSDGSDAVLRTVLFPLVGADGRPYAICGMSHDITAQRAAENAVRDAQQLLDLAATATRSLAYEWDPQTDEVVRSPQAMEILALGGEDLRGRGVDWFARVVAEDVPCLHRAIAALTPERSSYDEIYRYRRPDGGIMVLRDSGRATFDGDGRLVRVRGMTRDITASARVEEALRASEERLSMALEASGAGTWDFDPGTGAGSWSDGYVRLLGYQPGEVQPTLDAWLARVHPDDREAALASVREQVAAGAVSKWDARIQWPDGSVHWLRYLGRATARGPDGAVTRMRGVVIDVTDLRLAQEQVRALNADLETRVRRRTDELEAANRALRDEAAERLRAEQETARLGALIESTSDLVGISDLRQGRVRYVNRAMRDAVGHDATGMPVEDAIARTHPPDGIRLVMEEAVPAARRDGVWVGSNRVLRADGSEMPVSQVVLVMQGETDELDQVSTIMRDMSEAVRTETALRERAEALAEANAELARVTRMKDEFLANMSHELRTPLNAVLGTAEALREEVYGPIGARQREALDTVEQSGRHLLGLINDVLDLARIEAGRLTLDVAAVAIDAVCRASLRMVEAAAHAKGVGVSFTSDAAAPTIFGDERRLIQVLVNLLANAVKFTPAGGRVRLALRGDRDDGVVELSVEDDGIGIAESDLARLFQPFSQLDAGLNRQFGGSGLGLSIVRRLVDLHGGSVRVDSEPGRGSRFTVSLPWREVGTSPVPAGDLPAADAVAGAPLVLVVDDNEVNAQVQADFLGARGCRTRVARDGAEALRLAQVERPALVLMDIQMPGMDGLEATRALHALPGLGAVPIVAVTALAMPGDRERCLAAGASAYVAKPISLKGLVSLVRQLIAAGAAPGRSSSLPGGAGLLQPDVQRDGGAGDV